MPVVEVRVGGVAVSDGATLSTTGALQISCNVPYTLSVDGQDWVPIFSDENGDTYVITVGGRFVISADGLRLFSFTNTRPAPDFSIYQIGGHQEDISLGTVRSKYLQFQMRNSGSNFSFTINPSGPVAEQVGALAVTCNQGAATISTDTSSNSVVVRVSNVDLTQYLSVFVGNVLIAFGEPRA